MNNKYYLLTKSEVITGKYNDQIEEVNKLFIVWFFFIEVKS